MYKNDNTMSFESLISGNGSSTVSEPIVVPPSIPKDPVGMRSQLARPYTRRMEFFHAPAYFLVEDKLYGVPETTLPGAGYLKSALNSAEGTSEEDPIELNITTSQMDSLLSVLLARHINSSLELTISQWGEALGLATFWKLDAARNFVINNITHRFPDNLAEHIKLADVCGVSQWLHPAYAKICIRTDPPTEQEATALGAKRLLALWKIRGACRQPDNSKQGQMTCTKCMMACAVGETESSPGYEFLSSPRVESCDGYLGHDPTPATQEQESYRKTAEELIRDCDELTYTLVKVDLFTKLSPLHDTGDPNSSVRHRLSLRDNQTHHGAATATFPLYVSVAPALNFLLPPFLTPLFAFLCFSSFILSYSPSAFLPHIPLFSL
ncbi:hypothetical protein FRB93_003842 [Tulasnella sp. JGI-2019a]|nr:hypothetical protein FRB93_003842 [Tulasnella sp. JGI-2019a]